jgi:hypothetical protein
MIIEWVTESRRHGDIVSESHYARLGLIPLGDALEALWWRTFAAFTKETATWDTLIMSKRPDSGRVIAFPGLGGRFLYDRHIDVWIHSVALENAWYDATSEDAGEAENEKALAAVMEELSKTLCGAFRRPIVQQKFQMLLQQRHVEVVEIEFDDVETAATIGI